MAQIKFEELSKDVQRFIAVATKSVILIMDGQPQASKDGIHICFRLLQKMQETNDEAAWTSLGTFIDQGLEGMVEEDDTELEEGIIIADLDVEDESS